MANQGDLSFAAAVDRRRAAGALQAALLRDPALAALNSGLAAATPAQKKSDLDVVARAYTADVPMLSLGPVVQEVVLANNLKGATQTVSSIALFDRA